MNFRPLLVLLYCAAFAGCAHSDNVAATRGSLFPALRGADATEVLAYYQRIKPLPADALAAEHAAASQTLAKQKSDVSRLKLALLLLLPNTPFKDESRAAALAEDVLNSKTVDMPNMKNLALLIVSVASEQKRQEERLQQLALKLKEEEKRAEAAQQKLDALKTIEKDLINREQTKPLKVK